MAIVAVIDPARVLHLSPLERRLAATRLKVDLAEVDGPPVGALIGEAPGPRSSPKLPLFGYPPTSAGGRLMAFSGLTPAVYLGRLARRNLFETLPERWSAPAARDRVAEVLDWITRNGFKRVVLVGSRVVAAFDHVYPVIHDVQFRAIPHPSGLCRVYNDLERRKSTGATVRWAAGLE